MMSSQNLMGITEVIIKVGDNYFKAKCTTAQIDYRQDMIDFRFMDGSMDMFPGLITTDINLRVVGDPILTTDLSYKEDKTIVGGLLDVNKMINERREK